MLYQQVFVALAGERRVIFEAVDAAVSGMQEAGQDRSVDLGEVRLALIAAEQIEKSTRFAKTFLIKIAIVSNSKSFINSYKRKVVNICCLR